MAIDPRTDELARQCLRAVRAGEETADALLVALRRRALARAHLAPATARVVLEAMAAAEASGDTQRAALAGSLVLAVAADPPADLTKRLWKLARSGASTPLGPFLLLERLGEGSNAGVWRAVHAARPEQVAVKLVTGPRADDARVRRALIRELQVVAGLDHRAVVWLVDHGTVDAGAVAMTPALGEGTTWIALELASETLLAHCGRLDWLTVEDVLFQLLDGLAHAHARGVLHLDLKPSNVLVDGQPPQLHVRLADFGIARALDAGERLRVTGTPEFMAPEQWAADARALGPWTDLYALGCVAVMLVSGRPPYGRGTLQELRRAHRERPVPVLRPAIDLPMGFEAWTRRLLAKDPTDRFLRAADAAHALRDLRGAVRVPRGRGAVQLPTEPTRSDDPTRVIDGDAERASGPARSVRQPRSELPRRPPEEPTGRGRLRLRDAGLGLLPLRRAPLVGRARERSVLWAALRDAVGGSPCAVWLEGPPGVGVTRLGRWIAERAHEIGAVDVLDGRDGLVAAVLRTLRADGLDGEALRAHLRGVLPRVSGYELEALAELLEQHGVSGQARAVLVRILVGLARARPLLVRVRDDAEGRAVTEGLLDTDAPVLVVVEGRGGSDSEGADFARHDAVSTVSLPPLSDDEVRALIHGVLPLSPVLQERVVRSAAGSPRRALALIAHLAEQQALLSSRSGHTLADPTAWPLDLHGDVDVQRVEEAVAGASPAERTALALAALLGPRVDEAAWTRACAEVGVPVPHARVERLQAARLAVPDARGFALLGDGVLASLAPGPAEARALHRAVGEALLALHRHGPAAEHFEAAGEGLSAASAWLEAVEGFSREGRRAEASAAMSRWRRLEAALPSMATEDRVRGWLQVGWVARLERDLEGLEEAVARCEALAGPVERAAWAPELAMARANLAHHHGDLDAFEIAVQQARRAYADDDDAVGEARAVYRLGALARQRRQPERAVALLTEARDRVAGIDPAPPVLWSAELLLGTSWFDLGDLDRAAAAYQAVERAARATGNLSHLSDALNALGEVARARGDAETAARRYAEAIEIREAGGQRVVVARLNLALLYLQSGFFEDGDRHARLALHEARDSELPLLAAASALRLVALCTRDEARWQPARARTEERLRACAWLDPDVFTALQLAADRARREGHRTRATWCEDLAEQLRP